ncbi:arf-GAP with coiled-coil, ANK repeat and PH domain-containing protein 2 [Cimex lectularius]|uniref:Arf-GAP with coiled-coil, ANK repeat and PH domain-containing protein 2 n=1 Tax=Cimex lectularius TaxID=79782 RepID=A0A8I6RCJ0_CIMLE|nr:arf-GAP with coiled-coil, ANK repeat and PH domain-containing protein 2 [Cimex lectularius]
MVAADLLPECLRDSPKFRAQLAEEEAQIELLEQKLEKVLKSCGSMVDAGKTYVSQQTQFTNSLWELLVCFKDDPEATSRFNRLIQTLQEMTKYQSILLDQASRTILKNMSNFVKDDIKGGWDSRQHFDKISNDLDIALSRHSQVPKSKPVEIEQTHGILQATIACFRHTVLDHVYCISMLQSRKKPEILGTLLSYIQANVTYFHQGHDLCEGLQPFLRSLDEEIVGMRVDSGKLDKTLGNRHTMVINVDELESSEPMQGYLFKRTSNAFKTWHRRWFCLKDSQLVYRKRTGEENYTVMEEDLRLCSVKPAVDSERRFCFEVISPTRSHMLQADSEEMFNRWVLALQKGIGAALQLVLNNPDPRMLSGSNGNSAVLIEDSSNNNRKTKIWDQLARIPGNELCCDCKSPDPRWASINLGITLCIDCSGVHRSLGVHYSKVRSLTLDAWEPEILKVMAELGNQIVNNVYEAKLDSTVAVATPVCSSVVRESYIKRKWVNKDFVSPLSLSPMRPKRKWSVRKLRRRARSMESNNKKKNTKALSETKEDVAVVGENLNVESEAPHLEQLDSDNDSTDGEDNTVSEEDISKLSPTSLLHKASTAHNIPVMCHALALGADKHWVNPEQNGMTHLHQAVFSGSVMACEYLLLNGVKINFQDNNGKTALHHATELGHTQQVCLLLKHRADQHLKDKDDKEPLDVAVNMAHADIVTLLRLGRLNEEMKDSEAGTGDDTFNDVVRDFSQLTFTSSGKVIRPDDNNCKDSDKLV